MKYLVSVIYFLLILSQLEAASRGLQIRTHNNEFFDLPYDHSYALLIGVSDYTNGWPDIESIPHELKKVEVALKQQGFKVTTVLNPKGSALFGTFESFVDKYGYSPNNRLLFYFSGHGYTANNGTKGYLVPADAPNPNSNLRAFKRNAMNMGRLLTLSREMESKHALFIFDSCFSGTIFKTRALPSRPPYIERSMSRPVRQFITAGSANEEVPAKSTFTPMFIDAINGKADLNQDGYITGSELGMYLMQTLPNYENESPQYGKIPDYELSRGDFIFIPSKKRDLIQRHRLTLRMNPHTTKVRIDKIKQRYTSGMKLNEGTYTLHFSKKGYLPKTMEIDLKNDMLITVEMSKIMPKTSKFPLYIETYPNDATIIIYGEKEYNYFEGMVLPKGVYTVGITRSGYEDKSVMIELNRQLNLRFDLKELVQTRQSVKQTEEEQPMFFGF